MIKVMKFICMGSVGITLGALGVYPWMWQFWAILIPTSISGVIMNAEGYKEACGNYPWEVED